MDVGGMELASIARMITPGAVHALLRNEVTPGRTSTPKYNQPKTCSPLKASKKKLKLFAAIVMDKAMAMSDSDISSLYTESDSHFLFSLQEQCSTYG